MGRLLELRRPFPFVPDAIPAHTPTNHQHKTKQQEWPADLVILAMGFLNPEETIPKQLGLQVDQVGAFIDLTYEGWYGLGVKREG